MKKIPFIKSELGYADRGLPLIELRYGDLQKLDIILPEKLAKKGIKIW